MRNLSLTNMLFLFQNVEKQKISSSGYVNQHEKILDKCKRYVQDI